MQQVANQIWCILLFMIVCLPMVLLLYPSLRRALNEPFRREDILPCSLLMYLNLLTNRVIGSVANGLNILSSLLFFLITVRFVFRRRGVDLFYCMLRVVALLSAEEAACMAVFYLLSLCGMDLSHMMVLSLSDFFRVEVMISFSLLNCVSMLLVYLVLVLWQWLRRRRSPDARFESRKFWLYLQVFLRLTLLVFSGLCMLTLPFTLFGDRSLLGYLLANKEQYTLLAICCAVLMFIAFSYMLQDIRYIMQQDRINAMKKQQQVSENLTRSLRHFRHNMVNLLYGLEGLILSGDREKLTAYYSEMRDRCALVNNDNIAALEQLPSPALKSLLLRHMDRAMQLELPLNLNVQDALTLPRTLSDNQLCQVLGVLLDNAIEAAHHSAERSVLVELGNADGGGLEVLIKNTYTGEVTPGQLTRGGNSTKEGHSGQGLASCYHILSHKRGAFLNFWVTEQYVQAQLFVKR